MCTREFLWKALSPRQLARIHSDLNLCNLSRRIVAARCPSLFVSQPTNMDWKITPLATSWCMGTVSNYHFTSHSTRWFEFEARTLEEASFRNSISVRSFLWCNKAACRETEGSSWTRLRTPSRTWDIWQLYDTKQWSKFEPPVTVPEKCQGWGTLTRGSWLGEVAATVLCLGMFRCFRQVVEKKGRLNLKCGVHTSSFTTKS